MPRIVFILLLIAYFNVSPNGTHGAELRKSKSVADSVLFKQHVQYMLKEHRKLLKDIDRSIRIAANDSVSKQAFEQEKQTYLKACSSFYYLSHTQWKSNLAKSYQHSVTHQGLIEKTYQAIQQATRECLQQPNSTLGSKAKVALQKQSVYAKGKYDYQKKFGYKKLLDGLHDYKVRMLQEQLPYTSAINKQMPTASLPSVNAPVAALPKAQLPPQMQTNQQTQQTLQAKPSPKIKEPTPQQKFKEALNNPLQLSLDSTIKKDSLLFAFNPYRLMPLKDRLVFGGNNQVSNIKGNRKLITYAVNISYLWTPKLKPVLAFGYSHQLYSHRQHLHSTSGTLFLRGGMELTAYKMVAVFANIETNIYPKPRVGEKTPETSDFVMGITNASGKKPRLKFWVGLKVDEVFKQSANVFIFRVGL